MDQWTYLHTKGVLDQATAFELLRIAANVPVQTDIADKLRSLRQHQVHPCQPPIPLLNVIHNAVNQEAPANEPADQGAPIGDLDAQIAEESSDGGTSEDDGAEEQRQQNDSDAEGSSNGAPSEAPPSLSDPATPSSAISTPSPTGSIHSDWGTPKGTGVSGSPTVDEFDESKENLAFQSATGEFFPLHEAAPLSSDVSPLSSPNAADLEYQRNLNLTIAASSPGDDADAETQQEHSEDQSDSPTSSSSAGDDVPPQRPPIPCEPTTSRAQRPSIAHSVAQAIKKSDIFLKNSSRNLLVPHSRTDTLLTRRAAARKARLNAPPSLRLQQQRRAWTSEDASSGSDDPRAARSKSAPSESEEVCPVHISSRAFGAAVERNPGKLPDFECTCPKCPSCSKLLTSCECIEKQEENSAKPRIPIPSIPKMKTRFEGVPQGKWDPNTIRYEKFKKPRRGGGDGGGGDGAPSK